MLLLAPGRYLKWGRSKKICECEPLLRSKTEAEHQINRFHHAKRKAVKSSQVAHVDCVKLKNSWPVISLSSMVMVLRGLMFAS